MPKNWCFWSVVLGKTLESPSDCKEIIPVNPEGISPEYSLEGLMLKPKLQYFSQRWHQDAMKWLTGKDPDAGKDWRQEEKGTTEDEMVEWHHLLDGHEFEQAPGVGHGQVSLACFSPWDRKESDTTERLHWLSGEWPAWKKHFSKDPCVCEPENFYFTDSLFGSIFHTKSILCQSVGSRSCCSGRGRNEGSCSKKWLLVPGRFRWVRRTAVSSLCPLSSGSIASLSGLASPAVASDSAALVLLASHILATHCL